MVICAIALLGVPNLAGAQTDIPLPFCANPELDPPPPGPVDTVLFPRDDAARRPDFLRFRSELIDIVKRRDLDALLERVSSDVTVAFDGSGGREDFVEYHAKRKGFWARFQAILAKGGTFTGRERFAAPYVFSAWPEGVDPFGCMAVIGRNVRLRASPSSRSKQVLSLDYAIVKWLSDEVTDRRWVQVRVADGRTGYVDRAFVRSSVGLRAIFESRNGRWWLTALVEGD